MGGRKKQILEIRLKTEQKFQTKIPKKKTLVDQLKIFRKKKQTSPDEVGLKNKIFRHNFGHVSSPR